MKVSGFTIVRNAVALDFPIVESIRSILPICDEVVVNAGRSDDGTLALIRTIADPKVRILETEWDMSRGESVLRDETRRAMEACRYPWGVYIQADEVLHETGAGELRRTIESVAEDPAVEGVAVRYRHLFGDPSTEAVSRKWYRREVRAVRLEPAYGVHPFRDAQGFRVGPADRKIRARLSNAEMFHYGYVRAGFALRGRVAADRALYPARDQPEGDRAVLHWFPGLRPFRGTHPAVAREWLAARANDPDRRVTPRAFRLAHLRIYLSNLFERLTGLRPFEFRNYELV
ncbi:MAG: glycosyltransferase family 2 protein [Gemmatimonadota bacterium]